MSKSKENSQQLSDYEILFMDSNEYFCIENAKMIQEGRMVRFLVFNQVDGAQTLKENVWYPLSNIYRIKSYTK